MAHFKNVAQKFDFTDFGQLISLLGQFTFFETVISVN
jgi:hypothetical protein